LVFKRVLQLNRFTLQGDVLPLLIFETFHLKHMFVCRLRHHYQKIHVLKILIDGFAVLDLFVNPGTGIGILTNDSYAFAFDILEKAHVGVTPGVDFGSEGEGFIRFSYANSIENITKAMDRLEGYLLNFQFNPFSAK
jgi:hypothetical protein